MPLVLFILVTISFFMVRLAPGGPFAMEKGVSPEIRKNMERKYHLDEPIHVQFGYYLRDLWPVSITRAEGVRWVGVDLGHSFKFKDRTVNEIIAHHLPDSAKLGGISLALALVLGVTAGTIAAVKQNSIFDYASMTIAMMGVAIPTFVSGLVLMIVFAMWLGWFDVAGSDWPWDYVLPSVTLALPFAARIARLMRAGMLEIINQDYIKTARAKGLTEQVVVLRHAMKGALLPVVSYLGPATAVLLTGTLVVEKLFTIPGIGQEFVNSAVNRDYTTVLGLVLLFGTVLVVFNLIVDVAYGFLDPRIRYD